MFVGRLRFTGILFLKDGLDANGDGAPDGRGPLHKNGEVVQTSDGGWKISKFGDLPCYYEGDLDLGDCSMAGGNGGFYVGYEAREVYSGPFSPDCVTLSARPPASSPRREATPCAGARAAARCQGCEATVPSRDLWSESWVQPPLGPASLKFHPPYG